MLVEEGKGRGVMGEDGNGGGGEEREGSIYELMKKKNGETHPVGWVVWFVLE